MEFRVQGSRFSGYGVSRSDYVVFGVLGFAFAVRFLFRGFRDFRGLVLRVWGFRGFALGVRGFNVQGYKFGDFGVSCSGFHGSRFQVCISGFLGFALGVLGFCVRGFRGSLFQVQGFRLVIRVFRGFA